MDFYADNAGSATNVMRAEEDMVWWALIVGNLFQAYFSGLYFSANGRTSPHSVVG